MTTRKPMHAMQAGGVMVTADACHVRTVHLAVALQPLP